IKKVWRRKVIDTLVQTLHDLELVPNLGTLVDTSMSIAASDGTLVQDKQDVHPRDKVQHGYDGGFIAVIGEYNIVISPSKYQVISPHDAGDVISDLGFFT
ncbi:hypothetical protein Droror1_Dr00025286, partial [Drosera rotundifolia]